MSKMKLKIGEFSQMMQVTVKTLRHYEQKGLLLPDEVDEWTGYRYYSLDQMQKLQSIRDLQRLGFSLDEIKDLYDDVSHTPSVRQLTEKIKETEQQLKQLITRRNRLLDWRDSRKVMKTMEKFSIQSLPEIIVWGIRYSRDKIRLCICGHRNRSSRTGRGQGNPPICCHQTLRQRSFRACHMHSSQS